MIGEPRDVVIVRKTKCIYPVIVCAQANANSKPIASIDLLQLKNDESIAAQTLHYDIAQSWTSNGMNGRTGSAKFFDDYQKCASRSEKKLK